jgi:hypothetical protein
MENCYMRSTIWALLVIGVLPIESSCAGTIIGGSELLSAGHVNQLETWFGQGPLQLTNIYTKQSANATGQAFHAAADGGGPTFAILEVLGPTPQLIGGYNPISWDASLNNWVLTPDDADRTSFIFNLTSSLKQDQRLGPGNGIYQTYNVANYGPTFGGGADIAVFFDGLQFSYIQNGSFGPEGSNKNILGEVGISRPLIGRIEVFTIAPDASAPPVETPEPAGAVIWMLMASCGLLIRSRHARRVRT